MEHAGTAGTASATGAAGAARGRIARAGRSASLALAPLAAALAIATAASAGSPMPEGYPGRGRIGIEVQPMTAELREFFAAPPEHGLLIVRVEEGRPAEAADLRVGDVVIAAGGEPLVKPHDLVAIVARAPAGEPLELTVVRKKKQRTIAVVPDGAPASQAALEAWHERIGLPIVPAPAGEIGPVPAAGEVAGPAPAPAEGAPLEPAAPAAGAAVAPGGAPILPAAGPAAVPVPAPEPPAPE